MRGLTFDIAHMLAGSLVLVSFLQLYQDRLYALLNMFALHATVLALSVAWQAYAQNAPHLFVTAAIALVFKAVIIPVALHRIIVRLGIHRESEKVVGVGTAMLLGMGLVALAMVVMLRVTADADRASLRVETLPAGNRADNQRKDEWFNHASDQVVCRDAVAHGGDEDARRDRIKRHGGNPAAEDTEYVRKHR